jgi:hypothetical protein
MRMTTEGGIKKENNGCESPSRQIHAPGTLGNMQEQSKKIDFLLILKRQIYQINRKLNTWFLQKFLISDIFA